MQNNDSILDEVTPLEFFLSQNYPNPFKEKTIIKYCVAFRTRVQIAVYNSEGKLIEKLVDEEKDPGTYEVEFSTCHSRESGNLPDGYYFYRMIAGDFTSEKKWLCINKLSRRFNMKSFLQTLFFFLLVTQICFAQWLQTNGPYYGDVRSFAVSGTNLFAGTWDGGVILSTDNGTSWTAVNSGLPNSYVNALAVSGTNLFAGTYADGVFLSTNNGTSWTAVNTGMTATNVFALAVSGTNLFAGTEGGGVFRSTNNGASWTAVNNGLASTYVYSIAVSGTNLFAGCDGGYVCLSTNNGTSWTSVSYGLPNSWILALAVSGTNLFAGTVYGVFLSTNNGTSWTAVNSGLTNTDIRAFAVSGTNLFAGTEGGGVFLSTNNGTNWNAVNTDLTSTDVYSLAVSGTNLFAGTGSGVFLSTNAGTSWTQVSYGLNRPTVGCLGYCGTKLFAGTEDGIFCLTDSGASWVGIGMDSPMSCFATAGGNFLVGTKSDGVLLSTDCGGSWQAINTGLTENGVSDINALAISGERIFVTGGHYTGHGSNYWYVGRGVYLSTDTGSTWTEVNEGLPLSPTPGDSTSIIPINCLLAVGNNVFAGTDDGGVFLTTNFGTSWTLVNSGLPPTVLSLAVSETNLFAGTSGNGIYLSTDNGTSWTPINSGLPANKSVYALSVHDENLFMSFVDETSFTGVGIYLSTDNGTSWTPVSTGLPTNTIVYAFIVSGTNLFVGTEGSGVWMRPLSEMITDVEYVEQVPTEFSLSQNFPNPFNPSTKIKYSVPQSSNIVIKVFDILGNEIETLVNEEKPVGTYELTWNAASLPSGVYFYQLKAGSFIEAKKMLLLK